MNILVVEDNQLLRHHLSERLSDNGFSVLAAEDGSEALYLDQEFEVEVAIVDLGLPGEVDGFELIRRLRAASKSYPLLVLTARGNWEDKVAALQMGADDYVVKPFQFEELLARLNALLRRAAGFVRPCIEAGNLKLDLNRRQVFVSESPLALTAFEYRILEYLMLHNRQTISKERLLMLLYGPEEERDSNAVEVLVGRLRRKLEDNCGVNPIATIRGRGYLFEMICR